MVKGQKIHKILKLSFVIVKNVKEKFLFCWTYLGLTFVEVVDCDASPPGEDERVAGRPRDRQRRSACHKFNHYWMLLICFLKKCLTYHYWFS